MACGAATKAPTILHSQDLKTCEGAALESAEALGQLGVLTALRLFGHSADDKGRSAAFLEMLGAHPSLQQVEVASYSLFQPRPRGAGLEPQLSEVLRRRGWVRMRSSYVSDRLVFGAPGLCVQL